jgi:MFS transporter, ACS family, hexuronate transporter
VINTKSQEEPLPQSAEISPGAQQPSAEVPDRRRRWLILTLLFLLTVILFIARQTLSIMAPVLRNRFHLSNEAYGRIVSALGFGMMTGEFPVGALMDRLGCRLGLALAVGWWSVAAASLAAATGTLSLGLSQFWKGTGECGAYSGGVKTVTRLFGNKDRTLAIGIFNGGSVIGATLAPPVVVYLLQHYGFRVAFMVPSVAGALWIPLWLALYRREPNPSTKAAAPALSNRKMLASSSSWAVMLCRFFIGPVMQFYWYWTPSYLYNVRHLSMLEIGAVGWIPFLMGDVGGVLGGWAAGVLLRRGYTVRNMRRILMYGSALASMTAFATPYMHDVGPVLALLSIAIAADNFLGAHMFAAVTDLFPDHQVGRATGLTGIAGGLSGMLFPLLTGVLVDRISYTPVFACIALMPLMGTIALFAVGRRYRTLENLAVAQT